MLPGLTLILLVLALVLQVYVVAPLADNVAVPPGHIVASLTINLGMFVTDTVDTAVPVQPKEVPVTVYDVVTVGVTDIEVPVIPLLQE